MTYISEMFLCEMRKRELAKLYGKHVVDSVLGTSLVTTKDKIKYVAHRVGNSIRSTSKKYYKHAGAGLLVGGGMAVGRSIYDDSNKYKSRTSNRNSHE